MTPWHGNREAVFVLMRQIDEEAEEFDRRRRALEPPPGCLPVGGAHYDERLKCEALRTMLRKMRHGHDPETAARAALEESRALVRSWNANPLCVTIGGAFTVHRWEDTCGALLADRARRFAGIGPPGYLDESQLWGVSNLGEVEKISLDTSGTGV